MVHNVAPNNSTSALEESAAHSELMLFAEDNNAPITEHQYWTVLIVDDDPEIHKVTLLALRDFNFQNHKLKFISAFSASEAKPILASNHDIALVLLDVVMETDDAGLTLVHYIRDTLQNHLDCLGVGIVVEAEHHCMCSRGIKKQGSLMKTMHFTGVILNDSEKKNEFMRSIT